MIKNRLIIFMKSIRLQKYILKLIKNHVPQNILAIQVHFIWCDICLKIYTVPAALSHRVITSCTAGTDPTGCRGVSGVGHGGGAYTTGV